MLTTPAGQFKRKESPYYTMVHEMIHLGVEDIIVQKYGLNHQEKEHLVDLICSLKFKQQMPDYRIQPMANTALKDFVNPQTLTNLPRAIDAFVTAHPRQKHQ